MLSSSRLLRWRGGAGVSRVLRTCLRHAPSPLVANDLDICAGHPAAPKAKPAHKRGSHASAPQRDAVSSYGIRDDVQDGNGGVWLLDDGRLAAAVPDYRDPNPRPDGKRRWRSRPSARGLAQREQRQARSRHGSERRFSPKSVNAVRC